MNEQSTKGNMSFTCKTLTKIAVLQYRGLFLWNTPVSITSNAIVSPVLVVVTYYFIVRNVISEPLGSLLISVAIVAGGSTAASAVLQSASNDYNFGTKDARLMMPLSTVVQDLLILIAMVPIVVLTISSSTVAATILHASSPRGYYAWLAVVVIVAAASLVMFSGVISLLRSVRDDWVSGVLLINGLVLAGSGAIIPRTALPYGLDWLSLVVPTSHVTAAARSVLNETFTLFSFWRYIAFEFVLISSYAAIFVTYHMRIVRRIN
ncbi:MAG: hypothetical protein OXI18_02090 [bacterium]|nr:hypothetical protein [bacterium]